MVTELLLGGLIARERTSKMARTPPSLALRHKPKLAQLNPTMRIPALWPTKDTRAETFTKEAKSDYN